MLLAVLLYAPTAMGRLVFLPSAAIVSTSYGSFSSTRCRLQMNDSLSGWSSLAMRASSLIARS